MDTAAINNASPAEVGPSTNRLLAIDVARGFALLGIFLVNIQFFAEPFGSYVRHTPESSDLLTTFCFYFVKIFCEGKFYPLFSMLFGIGLALQMQSVLSRGGGFYSLYSRRLVWLFLMGLAHALLLWYGDILFIYSIAGFILMACIRIPPRVLLGIGIGIVVVSSLFLGAFTALSVFGASMQPAAVSVRQEQAADPAAAVSQGESVSADQSSAAPKPPFWRLMDGFETGQVNQPDAEIWMETETEAYRHGPWGQSFLFRAMSWLMILVFGFFGFSWHVLAMFFIGAGLLRVGLFSPEGERWHARFILAGLFIGVPGVVIGTLLPAIAGFAWHTAAVAVMLQMTCGPLVSLLYLCTFAVIVRKGIARPVTFVLSSVGRMALTNYLTQTVVSTFIFYHWGFAQFGTWSRPERVGYVLGFYALQCLISVLWMYAFRFGPMEWLWRSVTYFRPQPMLRGGGTGEAA